MRLSRDELDRIIQTEDYKVEEDFLKTIRKSLGDEIEKL
jgi:hypothetical protein